MRFFRSLAGAALFVAFAFSTPAQHIGDVSISTVQATVANNVTCTGSAQNFTTDGTIAGFSNIGQTSHLATATSNAATFQMEIDGIDNLGNVFRLSDPQVGVPGTPQGGLVVTAAGYMPKIRIKVTCTAAATFSVSYSGSFSPQPPNIASALLVSIDKLPFQNAPANTNASTTFQSPTGNSQGTIVFQFAATGPSGSSISAQCLTNAGLNLQLFTFTLATAAGPQLFPVPSSPCPFINLSYTSGGASATTYQLEYTFTTSGNSSAISDPCVTPSQKHSVSIALTTSTTTQLVAPVAGQTVYPCSVAFVIGLNSSATMTVQFEYGTGASCATGTTTLTGAIVGGAGTGTGPVPFSAEGSSQWAIPVSNGVCAVSVLTGTPTAPFGVDGWLTYVQQ